MKNVLVPHLNHHFRLVPREQLRRKTPGRTLTMPAGAAAIPAPPATFDGSKARAIKYPILGNDRYGDCYEADALHCVQTWTGNVGTEATFDVVAVVKEYLALSGGDNGLGDSDVFPHWRNPGFQGHRILDDMTVNPADDAAIQLAMWLFCGASWTCSLPDAWIDSAAPGVVWDAGTPNPQNGHAMHLSGYGIYTSYQCETWGIDPAIRLTPAGLKSADPEVTVQFSLEMFTPAGVAPHNGMSYDALAALWVTLGGSKLPPNPFGPPVPPPPPPPGPVVAPIVLTRAIRPGEKVLFKTGRPAGTYDYRTAHADEAVVE